MAVIYKTFEDRGVYVGFETRQLAQARLRMDKRKEDSYEVLIPNWNGADLAKAADMVMPFSNIPNWCELSPRDAILHERVTEITRYQFKHLDPIALRRIRLETDSECDDGYVGEMAAQELKVEKFDDQSSFLEILAMFARSFGVEIDNRPMKHIDRHVLLTLADDEPEVLKELVKLTALSMAKHSRIPRDVLQERLDFVALYSAPFCNLITHSSGGEVGFLSRQMQVIERFSQDLEHFKFGLKDRQARHWVDIVHQNLEHFIKYTEMRAEDIRMAVLDDKSYTNQKKHEELLDKIKAARIRISYALDGWATHAGLWLASSESDSGHRVKILEFILREMPHPPEEVLEQLPQKTSSREMFSMRRGAVMEMHSWFNDELDTELANRVHASRDDVMLLET